MRLRARIRLHRPWRFLMALAGLPFGILAHPLPDSVRWDSPSTNAWGTMPLGNGDVALNVRADPAGDVLLLLAKADAWDHKAHLLKLGRIRLHLDPNPFSPGTPFRQELHLDRGEIEIEAGSPTNTLRLRLWVDAHRPCLHLHTTATQPFTAQASLELWRTQRRVLSNEEASGVDRFAADASPESDPDVVVSNQTQQVVWYHRNERSIWESTLRHQGIAAFIPQGHDPLLHRTFGGAITGTGLTRTSPTTLASPEPTRGFALQVHLLTAQTPSASEWLQELDRTVADHLATPPDAAHASHRKWWSDFWARSWIHVTADTPESAAQADVVTRGYALQRFLNACASRGAFPIKFNGSLFTVEVPGKFDPDYRQWGGGYWFQNTRLPYWPMLAAGDFDLMEPLFRMYRDALPLALARTRIQFDHPGAYFPETIHFWGVWQNGDLGWGWDRKDEPPQRSLNQYIRFHWSGAIELLAMMLDRCAFTRDDAFFRHTVLPLADATLDFYAHHYPRQPDGRLLLVPSQALETWWETENPMPEVAGLRFTLQRLLRETAGPLGPDRRTRFSDLLAHLPEVPIRRHGEPKYLLPAEAFRTQRNMENPELYAVFPFRLFGVDKPDLPVALEAFRRRQFKGSRGWQQDDTQAAFLGLTEETRRMLVERFSSKHPESRFPAFWGPNFDWIPDQTHGGNGMMALQTMLLQAEDADTHAPDPAAPHPTAGGPIHLFPAWPTNWNVDFKLHAPGQTVVEGVYRSRRLERLTVTPPSREGSVVNHFDSEPSP